MDISGYTALADRLSGSGKGGAEELSRVLNARLGRIVDLIDEHGGDVLKFAGDALIALWSTPEPADSARMAAECALALRRSGGRGGSDIDLELRIGIATGEVILMQLETTKGHREIVVAGAALVHLTAIDRAIRPRDIVLTNRAWYHLQKDAIATPLDGGAVRLESLNALSEVVPVHGESVEGSIRDELLQPFIPPNILPRITAGHTDWLAELRVVTVVFVQVASLSQTVSAAAAQQLLSAIQVVLGRHEGSLNNISSDEKGIGILLSFGLPPLAHEDDAARGINAALAIEEELQKRGVLAAIGVATGRAFCGLLGSQSRVHYAVLGDVVNRAARVMEVSSSGTLCDETTFRAGRDQLGFETLPAVQVKGKPEPLRIYRPFRSRRGEDLPLLPLVGRRSELQLLEERLSLLKEERQGGVVLVEGEAGIGKSLLMQHLGRAAQKAGLTVISGAAEAIDASTAYHAWRSVLPQLIQLRRAGDSAETSPGALLEELIGDSTLAQFAPLLYPLLGLDLPGTPFTEELEPDIRSRNVQRLLLHIVGRAVTEPTVLLLEDAHWFDSASWQLTRLISQWVPNILIVISYRSGGGSVEVDHDTLIEERSPLHLQLRPFSRSETEQLIAARSGVSEVSPQLLEAIHKRAEGNPFFTLELVLELVHTGAFENGPDPEGVQGSDLQSLGLDLPESLQSLIVSRIDRLPPAPQLCLKVASVLGRSFSTSALRSIYPVQEDRSSLDDHLEFLAAGGLIQPDPLGTGGYHFQHAITQEATYSLLPIAQRKLLHEAAAEWYESVGEDELAPIYSLLVHHWRGAEVPAKLMRYLDMAGQQALTNAAYREAIVFFTEAQALVAGAGAEAEDAWFAMASRERKIGEACYALGKLREGRAHLQKAIASLDQPFPRHGFVSAAKEAAVQLFRRLERRDRTPAVPDQKVVEACLAYERIAEIDLFMGDSSVIWVYGILRNLNLAERRGTTSQAARSFAHMHALLHLMRFHSAAQRYERMALERAESSNHPAALAIVYSTIALSSIGFGQWGKAERYLEESIELCERIGYRRKREECIAMMFTPAWAQGRLDDDREAAREVMDSATKGGDTQAESWGWHEIGRIEALHGRVAEALETVAMARKLAPRSLDPSEEVRLCGLEALAHLRLGNPATALAAAMRGVDQARQAKPMTFWASDGYANVAEVLLELSTRSDPEVQAVPSELRDAAGSLRDGLRRLARLFPIAEPCYARVQGSLAWLEGRPNRAFKYWRRSLAAAERLSMPYHTALAHLTIGTNLPAGSEDRREHLKKAERIFAELGAPFESERARAELDGKDGREHFVTGAADPSRQQEG